MDIFSLECFLAIVETGSFTKAAEKVRRTQSAITQQIHSLEKTFGVPLFIRGKKVELTEKAHSFLPQAIKMIELHREILDHFKHPELMGKVSVGFPEDFATLFLSDILKDFSAIHPRISLCVECDLTINLLEQFRKGTLDLILVKMPDKHLSEGVEIWKDPLVWVGNFASSHAIKNGEPISLVVSAEPCIYRARAIKALNEASIPFKIVYTSPSYAGRIAAVEAGLGITVLPQTMIPERLQKVIIPELPSLHDIHICLLKKEQGSNAALESLHQFIVQKITKNILQFKQKHS